VAKVLNFWDRTYFVPLTNGIKKNAATAADLAASSKEKPENSSAVQEQQARYSIALESDTPFPESRTPLTRASVAAIKDTNPESKKQSLENIHENQEESGDAVWKYTTNKLESKNPDEAVYYAEWSEPSKLTPFPRAKAGVKFTISRLGRISYQFENHRLVHSHDFPDINTVSDAVFESELEKTLASAPDIVDNAVGYDETVELDGPSFSNIAKQMAKQTKELDHIELSKLKYNFITKSTLGVPSKRIIDIINSKLRVSNDIAAGALMGGEIVPGFGRDDGESNDELAGMKFRDLDDIIPPYTYTAEDLMTRSGVDQFREPIEEAADSEFDEEDLNNPKVCSLFLL
jgi:hypothetical protein